MNGKSKTTAAVLAFFLGWLGIHNFYLGYKGKAIGQLLITILSLGTLAWVSGIWALIEFILILTGKIAKDAMGVPFDSVQAMQQAPATFNQPLAAQSIPQQAPTTFTQPTALQSMTTFTQPLAAQPMMMQSATTETVACPYCGETINAKAIKCKHCQSSIINSNTPQAAITVQGAVDKTRTLEDMVAAFHSNHRQTHPASKRGSFGIGTSPSQVFCGAEITPEVLGAHSKSLTGFDPNSEKVLVVINRPKGLAGMVGGMVLTTRAFYFKLSGGGLIALPKGGQRVDINNVKSIVVGDSNNGYGGAYNGHELFLNGQKFGILRMGIDTCEDDEVLEFTTELFKLLTANLFSR